MTNREKLPWLSFDCYDTLVRYSENKASRLKEIVNIKGGNNEDQAKAQETFNLCQRAIQAGPFRPLNEVLCKSLKGALDVVSLPCSSQDETAIIEAVCTAPPFPDVAAALAELRPDFRLDVLSNSEPDIIRHNIIRIGVGMDAIVLASEAKCYKPSVKMFDTLLSRIDATAIDVTHVAQSFYHDIRPAKDKGFGQRIWINRYGHTGDPEYVPDHELPNLSGLRKLLIG